MTGLVIPIYARPHYLKRCFDSLRRITTKPDVIILYDDASVDPAVIELAKEFSDNPICKTITLRALVNSGIRSALREGVDYAFGVGCDVVVNMDSDMIGLPHFLQEILSLQAAHPAQMVSGINCTMRQKTGEERNPLISEHENYYLKKYVAGQCLCYNEMAYNKFVRPALLIDGNWDHNASIASDRAGLPIVVCKPSVVQHIGIESSMGHNAYGELPDEAADFDIRLQLPSVTLFGVDANNPVGMLRAAEICQREIKFGEVKIITQRIFPGVNREDGRRNYSHFMIKHLTEHFNTSHVLTIHDDGYIQNPLAWNDKWLEWDFIGAVWDWHREHQVGNGGFSLRSKKLCDILASDDHIREFHPEDDRICRKYRPYLESVYGIKFAPAEVAKQFSIEGWGLKPDLNVYSGEFGFHGHSVRGLKIPIKI